MRRGKTNIPRKCSSRAFGTCRRRVPLHLMSPTAPWRALKTYVRSLDNNSRKKSFHLFSSEVFLRADRQRCQSFPSSCAAVPLAPISVGNQHVCLHPHAKVLSVSRQADGALLTRALPSTVPHNDHDRTRRKQSHSRALVLVLLPICHEQCRHEERCSVEREQTESYVWKGVS